ncbi:MAG: ABC transporter substrate-binding protein [Gemmatimonadaceae bacterium]|nr:ABC transporter substrate-binding protein [Gemmatimonadaceae bacterium]
MSAPSTAPDTFIPSIRHARHFELVSHPLGTLVRILAPVDDSLSAREHRLQASMILVLRPNAPGPARHARRGDTLVIRAPALRWAINSNDMEAYLSVLGLDERLVAVGGSNSYNDQTRARALRGALGQVGYGWHSPPNLDVLVASDPDVFLIRLKRMAHAVHLTRALSIGVPAVPSFLEEEPTYLGRAEWVQLFGVLAGVPTRADSVFRSIERRVDSLRALVHDAPRRNFVWAYFEGRDRWRVTARGPLVQMVEDAGGRNLYGDNRIGGGDFEIVVGTEALLERATHAECWIAGDGWPEPSIPPTVGAAVRAYRDRCVTFYNGRVKPTVDAWDWYQTAFVRPDLVLAEFIRVLHPARSSAAWDFLRPYPHFASR